MSAAFRSFDYIVETVKAIEAQRIMPLVKMQEGKILGIYTSFPDDSSEVRDSNPHYARWCKLVKDQRYRNEVAEFLKATGRIDRLMNLEPGRDAGFFACEMLRLTTEIQNDFINFPMRDPWTWRRDSPHLS